MFILLSTPSLFPSHPRWLTQVGASAHLTEHLLKGKEENNGKSHLFPESLNPFFCKQPAHDQSCKRCSLVLPRYTDNLMDRMTLPPLFIPGIKWY